MGNKKKYNECIQCVRFAKELTEQKARADEWKKKVKEWSKSKAQLILIQKDRNKEIELREKAEAKLEHTVNELERIVDDALNTWRELNPERSMISCLYLADASGCTTSPTISSSRSRRYRIASLPIKLLPKNNIFNY